MGRSDWDYSGHHPRHVGLFVAGQDWELPPGTMPLVLPPLAGRYPRCNRREDLEVLILRCRPFPTARTKVPLGGFEPSTLRMQDERSNHHTIALIALIALIAFIEMQEKGNAAFELLI